MKIYIQKEQKQKEMRFRGTAGALLKKLGIDPRTVIVTKNDSLVSEDDKLEDSDTVEILDVVSGG